MNDNVPPSLAARLMVRGALIAFAVGAFAHLGWAAAGWIIG